MMDLGEEMNSGPEEQQAQIIMPSASLTDSQKQAIQTAITKMFFEQAASTQVYSQIIASLAGALQATEVAESTKRLVVGLKELIKVFFKNVQFTPEQSAKVRDILETLKELAALQMNHLNSTSLDEATIKRIALLQERVAAHSAPISVGIQEVLTQELVQNNQKHILDLVLDLIKDALSILPAHGGANGNPPAIAQPLIPDHLEQTEEEAE